MKIQSMFQKDIDRPINGVVKVMQDDQHSYRLRKIRENSNYFFSVDARTDKTNSICEH